jgi:hypothetical protein
MILGLLKYLFFILSLHCIACMRDWMHLNATNRALKYGKINKTVIVLITAMMHDE